MQIGFGKMMFGKMIGFFGDRLMNFLLFFFI